MTTDGKLLDTAGAEYVRNKLSRISFGTYLIDNEKDLSSAVETALKVGYRSLDTAQCYRNENFIGNTLKKCLPQLGLTREDIFITTKVRPSNMGTEATTKSIERTLSDLGTDYVDLLLIHWPGSSRLRADDPKNKVLRKETWQALETAFDNKKVRAIGISNYNVNHLEELLEFARVQPALNQIELHPHYFLADVVHFCRQHDIIVQAYSSLGTSDRKLIQDEKVLSLAKELNKTPAQILLAWSLSQNIYVIPKSLNPAHIKSNLEAGTVTLSDEMVARLKSDEVHKFCWDPESVA